MYFGQGAMSCTGKLVLQVAILTLHYAADRRQKHCPHGVIQGRSRGELDRSIGTLVADRNNSSFAGSRWLSLIQLVRAKKSTLLLFGWRSSLSSCSLDRKHRKPRKRCVASGSWSSVRPTSSEPQVRLLSTNWTLRPSHIRR